MTGPGKLRVKLTAPVLALATVAAMAAADPLLAQRKPSNSGEPRTEGKAVARSSSSSRSSGAVSQGSSARDSGSRRAVDTRRSTTARRSRDRGYRGYRGRRGHFGVHLGYYDPYYRFSYYHYPYPYLGYYWGVPYYVPRRARTAYDLGAFDLNVRPKKAEVYVDGQYVGTVRQFDGWPGYLWLEEGTYELIFFRPGFATEKRILTVYPGLVIDVRVELVPGESVPPEQLSSVDRSGPIAEVRSAYEQQRQAAEPRRRAVQAPSGEAELDTRAAPGRVRVTVRPGDASVYLDGRFLGSGEELAGLRAGLVVEAGSHMLEVVRPGYGSERLEFTVEEGAEVELEVLLKAG